MCTQKHELINHKLYTLQSHYESVNNFKVVAVGCIHIFQVLYYPTSVCWCIDGCRVECASKFTLPISTWTVLMFYQTGDICIMHSLVSWSKVDSLKRKCPEQCSLSAGQSRSRRCASSGSSGGVQKCSHENQFHLLYPQHHPVPFFGSSTVLSTPVSLLCCIFPAGQHWHHL